MKPEPSHQATQNTELSRRGWIRSAFALIACQSLVACGGGGGAQDAVAAPSPNPPPPPAPPPGPTPPSPPAPTPPSPPPPPSGGSTLVPFKVVRTGARFATLKAAVEAAVSGDTIQVAPGRYTISAFGDNDPGMTRIPGGINLATLTIEWEVAGTRPVIDLSAYAFRDGSQGGRTVGIEAGPNNRQLTIRGLHLIGDQRAGDPYGINSNQGYLPGVGFDGSPAATLTIEYCKIEKWADGVKNTVYNRNLTTNVRYTTIEDCTANYLTHGIYVNGELLDVLGCTIRTTLAGRTTTPQNSGHLIKSRTRRTTVRGSLIDGAGGCASCIEAPNGGVLEVLGNIILHYGQTSSSDDNPAVKYGFEEGASRIVVSLSAAPLAVNDVVTGTSSGGTARITHVLAGNTYVFEKLNSSYLSAGEGISVGGIARGTITSKLGSPDGTSNDGRSHSVRVSQNTIRKKQPGNWAGSPGTAMAMMWTAANMTTDAGVDLPLSAISRTVRNNIVGDLACGNRTIEEYPLNSAATLDAISDLGVYAGGSVPGNPLVNDAAFAWAGEFNEPRVRTDTNRGGL